GGAGHVADLPLRPRTLHATFVRSPVAHGHILAIDVEQVEAMPGVVCVLTGRELEAAPLVDPIELEGLLKTPQRAIPPERVRFVGEAVAAVVAETAYEAQDAARTAAVEYEELEPVTDVERAMQEDSPLVHPELGTNVLYRH